MLKNVAISYYMSVCKIQSDHWSSSKLCDIAGCQTCLLRSAIGESDETKAVPAICYSCFPAELIAKICNLRDPHDYLRWKSLLPGY